MQSSDQLSHIWIPLEMKPSYSPGSRNHVSVRPNARRIFPGLFFSIILTNQPFGKKSSVLIVIEQGALEKEGVAYTG